MGGYFHFWDYEISNFREGSKTESSTGFVILSYTQYISLSLRLPNFFQAVIYIIDVAAKDKPPSVEADMGSGHQDVEDKD